ncbi:Gluconate 2-dehydrogenase subunit 3 [Natronorubrum sediminis]|uniref:Gluconate 2-dehydrogenase subunit 3 n=1 Tax=Natronorubrum sediminis TaxID=640943 RepID=A0A1H6FNI0_9EURY|nr:gluconate 2-dehydrogenase subunit 3 family protein [Natronorubrum sediminis]SEH11902.1 Gluconate 2-dehydrogenase subunit 3 [Natronorubrum sediminis]
MPDDETGPDGEAKFDFTRRGAMMSGGAFIGASILTRRARAETTDFSLEDVEEAEIEKQGLQFFTLEQAEIVQEMANRIYPSDDNGPGAPEAGVVYFIDRQMNQDWGQGERWYMDGPFPGVEQLELDTAVEAADPVGDPTEAEGVGTPPAHTEEAETDDGEDDEDDGDDENSANGENNEDNTADSIAFTATDAGIQEVDEGDDDDTDGADEEMAEDDGEETPDEFEEEPDDPDDEETEVAWADEEPAAGQGWQHPMTPADAYTYSIDFVEAYCEEEYDESFVDLGGEEQDDVIQALEDDEVETFEGLEPSDFFLLLRENTLEGMFSDPMYGGNQEMVGWRLKNFPGSPGALGSFREHIEDDEYQEVDEPRSIADDVEEIGLNPDGDHDH